MISFTVLVKALIILHIITIVTEVETTSRLSRLDARTWLKRHKIARLSSVIHLAGLYHYKASEFRRGVVNKFILSIYFLIKYNY